MPRVHKDIIQSRLFHSTQLHKVCKERERESAYVRACVRACVRRAVRACERAFVRSFVRSFEFALF